MNAGSGSRARGGDTAPPRGRRSRSGRFQRRCVCAAMLRENQAGAVGLISRSCRPSQPCGRVSSRPERPRFPLLTGCRLLLPPSAPIEDPLGCYSRRNTGSTGFKAREQALMLPAGSLLVDRVVGLGSGCSSERRNHGRGADLAAATARAAGVVLPYLTARTRTDRPPPPRIAADGRWGLRGA